MRRLAIVTLIGLCAAALWWVSKKEGRVAPRPLGAVALDPRTAAVLSDSPVEAGSSGERARDRRPSAEGEEAGGEHTDREARGELRLLSEEEFLRRLEELGIGGGRDLFDRIHQSSPDEGTLVVVVTGPEQETIEGAALALDSGAPRGVFGRHPRQLSASAVQARSDANGLANFVQLDPGEYLLMVRHEDYDPRYQAGIPIEAGRISFLEVELARSQHTISGRVTDTNLVPQGGAIVEAERHVEGSLPFRVTTSTDYEGHFSLRVTEGSRSDLRATKVGYSEVRLPSVRAGAHDLLIRLEPTDTARVRGRVRRGSTDEPVTSFQVDGEAFFDPDGRFEVERNVQPGEQVLTFTADGFRPKGVPYRLTRARDLDLGAVPLYGETELNGIVLLESGEGAHPVAGALVRIETPGGDLDSMSSTAEGAFSFRDVDAETVALSVVAAGASPWHQVVALAQGEPTYVEVVLHPGEYRASGRVVDAGSDEPLEGVRIEVQEFPALAVTTGGDGRYELDGIPEASFQLRASHLGYRAATSGPLRDDGEGARWDVELEPGGLRVELRQGGAPLPAGVEVVLWRAIAPTLAAARAAQADLASHRFVAETDEDGRVAFEIDEGTGFLQAADYRLLPTPVTIDHDAEDWLVVEVPGRTRLTGRIRGADGAPIANTSLWLHSGDQDYSTMFLYHTDAQGRYSIPNLAPRVYALSIIKSAADQSAQWVHEFQANGAPEQSLDVSFPPLDASIHGTLTDDQGQPRAGAWIGVEYLDAPHRSILAGWVATDASGSYEVPRLGAGRHRVRTAWGSDENVYSGELVLANGEARELDLVQPRTPGRHVRGSIIAGDGGPLGPNFLFATDAAGRQNGNYFSTMDWGYVGDFDVTGLAPGAWAIRATAMGARQAEQSVAVASDVDGVLFELERE